MRILVMASGSKGNAIFVETDGKRFLVDAGISASRIKNSLASVGVAPTELDGLLLTHEHRDHAAGLSVLVKRYRLRVFARRKTLLGLREELPDEVCTVIDDGFTLGGVRVKAFSAMHDAADPVGFTLTGSEKIAVATDLGFVTNSVQTAIEGADALIIEANHDVASLKSGSYPWRLKQRILSNRGHLSNSDAAWAVARMKKTPKEVILAHLSEENNRPELARTAVETVLKRQGIALSLSVASQNEPLYKII